jgi:hypothetical protein
VNPRRHNPSRARRIAGPSGREAAKVAGWRAPRREDGRLASGGLSAAH